MDNIFPGHEYQQLRDMRDQVCLVGLTRPTTLVQTFIVYFCGKIRGDFVVCVLYQLESTVFRPGHTSMSREHALEYLLPSQLHKAASPLI